MAYDQTLIRYTVQKVAKLLDEGFVVTTKRVALQKVDNGYEFWSYSKKRWIWCTWMSPVDIVAVLASRDGYIQYTRDEFSLMQHKL